MALSEEELQDCQDLIDDKPPGIYELKELYGNLWLAISDPTRFGKDFRKAVKDKALINIEESHMDLGDKHWRYKLHGG